MEPTLAELAQGRLLIHKTSHDLTRTTQAALATSGCVESTVAPISVVASILSKIFFMTTLPNPNRYMRLRIPCRKILSAVQVRQSSAILQYGGNEAMPF
jgi:hypothetical protein